jgi:hypothetical protein
MFMCMSASTLTVLYCIFVLYTHTHHMVQTRLLMCKQEYGRTGLTHTRSLLTHNGSLLTNNRSLLTEGSHRFHTSGASFDSRRASNSISRCLEVVALAQGGQEEEEGPN